MGRSRKKTSGGQGSLSEGEMRKAVVLLAVSSILIVLVIIVIVSGEVRRSVNPGPQLAAQQTAEMGTPGNADGSFSDAAGDGMETDEADGADADRETSAEELVIEPDNKEYFHDFGGSILTQDAVPEMNQLMEQYFMSISDCDMATFLHLFTSQDTSEEEFYRQEFEQQKQYIEGYQNISCYTTPGMNDGEMAAYVYYEIRYTGVETPAPSLVRIYAVQGEDGQYRIYDEEISPELEHYLTQLAANEDVRLLGRQVDQKMKEAMEADQALRERVEFMKNGASYMQEETAEEEVSSEESEAPSGEAETSSSN